MASKDRKRGSRSRNTGRSWRSEEEDYPGWEGEESDWDEPRLMDMARKLVRGGAEVLVTTKDGIRERTGEIKAKEIPKEVVESVAHLTARTKDELVGLMAREFKNYLEKLDVADEMRSMMEQYTLDVNMSIRLRPNDAYVRPADEEDDEAPEDEAPEATTEEEGEPEDEPAGEE